MSVWINLPQRHPRGLSMNGRLHHFNEPSGVAMVRRALTMAEIVAGTRWRYYYLKI
jgi:hypothetical protein